MQHYKAILAIQKRITVLQHEISQLKKIIDHSEMLSDVFYATNDIDNF